MNIRSGEASSFGFAQKRLAVGFGDGGVTISHLGGVRLRGLNATWPLARLNFYASGIRLMSSSRALQRLIPLWEARWDEIEEIQAVGKIPWLSTGIRIRTQPDHRWVIFWTFHRDLVMSDFQKQGIKVNISPVSFNIVNPGR
jgi:hypothetical protein